MQQSSLVLVLFCFFLLICWSSVVASVVLPQLYNLIFNIYFFSTFFCDSIDYYFGGMREVRNGGLIWFTSLPT